MLDSLECNLGFWQKGNYLINALKMKEGQNHTDLSREHPKNLKEHL